MSALIGVAVVVGLCFWILIDMSLMRRRKIAAPSPIDPSEVKAKQLKQGRIFMIGVGMAAYAMAYNEWISPSHPPFSGKFSSMYFFLYQKFGPQAISVWWIGVGTVFIFLGFLKKPAALSPNSSLHTDAPRQ